MKEFIEVYINLNIGQKMMYPVKVCANVSKLHYD